MYDNKESIFVWNVYQYKLYALIIRKKNVFKDRMNISRDKTVHVKVGWHYIFEQTSESSYYLLWNNGIQTAFTSSNYVLKRSSSSPGLIRCLSYIVCVYETSPGLIRCLRYIVSVYETLKPFKCRNELFETEDLCSLLKYMKCW